MFGLHCNISFEFRLHNSPRQENKFEYTYWDKHWKVNLLVISVITNCKQRLAVRYRSEYCSDVRHQRISFLKVLEFSVKPTYLFASIRHKWQNSLCKEHASDMKYYQWLERGAHVAWQRKYETWEIPRFVGRTISKAGRAGVGWHVHCISWKCIYIGKKGILHNSSVRKKIHARSLGWKKICWRCSLVLPGLTAWTLLPSCYDK